MDRWEYLTTREYQIRQYICEYFLQDVDYIIDVGAYKTTFNGRNVIAIDPLKTMINSYHGTLSEWYNSTKISIDNCGAVFLGLEIVGGQEEIDCFLKVVKESKITVLEFAKEHTTSVIQFNMAIQNSEKKIIMEIDFNFPNVISNGFPPYPERKMYILGKN